MFAMWFFLTLYLQQVLGYSPLITGFTFLPQTAAIAIGATFGRPTCPQGRATAAHGGRRPVSAGGLYWLSLISAGGTYWSDALGGGVLCTLGMGLAFTPIAVAATGGVRREEAGLASGVMNTSRQIGASVGLAVLSTAAASRIASLEGGHQVTGELARTAMTAGYARGFQIGAPWPWPEWRSPSSCRPRLLPRFHPSRTGPRRCVPRSRRATADRFSHLRPPERGTLVRPSWPEACRCCLSPAVHS